MNTIKVVLPFDPQHILHKHGGRITRIVSIGHETDRPQDGYSRDFWFYNGCVTWGDGSGNPAKVGHIYPYDLCADGDEGLAEINAISELMMQYLADHGSWDPVVKGKAINGWFATNR